jgi:hypothetical protein
MTKMTLEEKEKRKQERNKLKYEREHKIIKGVDHKYCNLHNEYFPEESYWVVASLDYFYKNVKNSIDGLSTRCKRCEIKKAYQHILDNPEAFKASYKRYMKTDSWKEYKRENNIKTKDIQAQWRKDNPEKCKENCIHHRDHDITTKEWKSNQEAFNYTCAYCGKTYEEQYNQNKQQFHKEHVYHDGYNDVRNCVPCCSQCNSTKRKREIQELFESGDIIQFTQGKYNKIIEWCSEEYKKCIENKPPYKIKRSQVKNDDGTYYYIHQLWTVDEKRNALECILKRNKRKDIIKEIQKGNIKFD